MSLFGGPGGGIFGGGPGGGGGQPTFGSPGSSGGPGTVSSSIFHSTYRDFMRLLASDVMAGPGGDKKRDENEMGGVLSGFRRQSTKRQSLVPGSSASASAIAAALRRVRYIWIELDPLN